MPTHSSTFFFHSSGDHPDLHSFPTRRSSDLTNAGRAHIEFLGSEEAIARAKGELFEALEPGATAVVRSEEHTSELQSQSNLVCRLLLEKKKHIGILALDFSSLKLILVIHSHC